MYYSIYATGAWIEPKNNNKASNWYFSVFYVPTLLVQNQSAVGFILIRGRGIYAGDNAKIANRPNKTGGREQRGYALSIANNSERRIGDNSAARATRRQKPTLDESAKRDETEWNETKWNEKQNARRGMMGKSEESAEERVSADRYITGKARPR